MNANHKHPDFFNELDWLAFRYIANEMSDAERGSFELQLESDLLACEAVARAVELTTTIHAAEILVPANRAPHSMSASGSMLPDVADAVSTRTSWPARLSWLALGAGTAAALMAIVSSIPLLSTGEAVTNVPTVPAAKESGVTTDLAIIWSETLPVVPVEATFASAEPTIPLPVAFDAPQITSESLDETSSDNSIEPPSWMLAAVQSLAEEEQEMDSERDLRSLGPFGSESMDN